MRRGVESTTLPPMAKFRITYRHSPGDAGPPPDEEVEAMMYLDEGDWIDFYATASVGNPGQHRNHVVLRVRASQVQRIEQVKS
jgi:hypothetical protein